MQSEYNALLAQVPLTVSPFITLPKAPTLPHNYATLPSMLPPSILSAPPIAASDNPASPGPESQLPAYITSASGFRAHPSSVLQQNMALRDQLAKTAADAQKTIQEWLDRIKERELAEKRRKAPGWLDSDEKMLKPQRPGNNPPASAGVTPSLLDSNDEHVEPSKPHDDPAMSDLGAQMDRAFS